MFETRSHDFGTVARGAKAECEFVFKNKYIQDIHVSGASVSCSCTSVSIRNPSLKTYDTGAVVAKFNTKAFRGQRGATITVTIDKPSPATVQLHVKGNIRDDVVIDPPSVDFGEIDRGTAAERVIRVSHSGRGDWRVLEVQSASPHLTGEVERVFGDRGRLACRIRVRLDGGAPVGYLRDHLILVTNDRQSRQIPVQVEGRVCPVVTVSPSPLYLGVFGPGDTVTRPLVVRARKAFRVFSVTSDHQAFTARLPDPDSAKPVHVIPVTFNARSEPGKVVETIRIETDLEGQTTEVSALAVVRK